MYYVYFGSEYKLLTMNEPSCFQTLRATDRRAESQMADIEHKNTGVTSEVNELSS